MAAKAVIVGAGALGLGFLAEKMAGDYDFCLVDVTSQAEQLRRIEQNQGYVVNICTAEGIVNRKVSAAFATAFSDGDDRTDLDHALQEAELVLTATSRNILDIIVALIAPPLNARGSRVHLLFCENGHDIAGDYRKDFSEKTTLVDTIMSRMCRFADAQEEKDYQPLWPGCETALVVEEYGVIPLDKELCAGGAFSPAFTMVSREEFLAWEDIKLYLHNGMHAFIACHAFLTGARFFPETPDDIREMARNAVLAELVPAILQTHPVTQRAEVEQYGLGLLQRFFNPFFNDSIERGTRGLEQKLAAGERLRGGCELIKNAGVEPTQFATAISAAQTILAQKPCTL